MPIPKPKSNESQEEFISRCMSDEKMKSDYDNEQRYAICINTYTEMNEVIEELKDILLEETYNDYPQQATENAKIALRYAEENGWGSCGTLVGKQRANQLAFLKVYNRVFKTNEQPTTCASCLNDMLRKIKMVYNEYPSKFE